MSTASAYINKIRVETTVRNNKVEYPGKVAKNVEHLAATCRTNPSFTVLSYTKAHAYCGLRNHGCTNK
jgi:hypothetical protein